MRPHRIVGEVADGLIDGVNSIGGTMVRAAEGLGETVMSALDKPFEAVTHREGPHRAIDRLARGTIEAGRNAVERGFVGTIKKEGEAIMKTLDHPAEQTGFPPDLGKFEMPKIFGK